MSETVLIQSLISGLVLGSLYALVAGGFNLVAGVVRIINFAHAEFYMLGAYVTYALVVVLHQSYIVGILGAFVSMAVLGLLFQRFLIRYVYGTFMAMVVSTIAFSWITSQTALVEFGMEAKFMKSVFDGGISVAGMTVPYDNILLIILSACLLVGLAYFMKLRVGKAMRAVSEDQEIAALQGIKPQRIFLVAMALGCGVAGVAGALIAPVMAISSNMGNNMFVMVMLACITGGMGSMSGALMASYAMGLVASFGYQIVGTYNILTIFVLMLILLYFKPGGIKGGLFRLE